MILLRFLFSPTLETFTTLLLWFYFLWHSCSTSLLLNLNLIVWFHLKRISVFSIFASDDRSESIVHQPDSYCVVTVFCMCFLSFWQSDIRFQRHQRNVPYKFFNPLVHCNKLTLCKNHFKIRSKNRTMMQNRIDANAYYLHTRIGCFYSRGPKPAAQNQKRIRWL